MDNDLPGPVFTALVALAALSGWLIVRMLRYGRLEMRGRFVIDRARSPFLFWGVLAVIAAIPVAYLAYILAAM